MPTKLRFEHLGKEYKLSFEPKWHKTATLLKRGILQPKKTKVKQEADPESRRCIHCTVAENGKPVAYGMSVCSPTDKFKVNSIDAQKASLRRAISRARKAWLVDQLHNNGKPTMTNLDADWAVEAWQTLFDSRRIDARGARRRKRSADADLATARRSAEADLATV